MVSEHEVRVGDGSVSFLGPFPSYVLSCHTSYLMSTITCFPIMSRAE